MMDNSTTITSTGELQQRNHTAHSPRADTEVQFFVLPLQSRLVYAFFRHVADTATRIATSYDCQWLACAGQCGQCVTGFLYKRLSCAKWD